MKLAGPNGVPSILPRVAASIAFFIAGGIVLGAMGGQFALLPFAAVPVFAGIGIMRSRVWSAYGFALFECAQLLLFPLLFLRAGSTPLPAYRIGLLLTFDVVIIAVFFAAGRSLRRAGAERGRAWPWIAVSALCILPRLFFQGFVIPTGSMEDTLLLGDHILVQTFPKTTPARGDIVVFPYPVDRRQTFVKRIIGVPGDRIHLANKTVYRNGAALTEPYAVHRFPLENYRDNFPAGVGHVALPEPAEDMLAKHVVNGDVVVPAGKYFVLGDNRDNSLDSRYWGFLDGADITGRPRLIYEPEEPRMDGLVPASSGGLERVRWGRFFKLL